MCVHLFFVLVAFRNLKDCVQKCVCVCVDVSMSCVLTLTWLCVLKGCVCVCVGPVHKNLGRIQFKFSSFTRLQSFSNSVLLFVCRQEGLFQKCVTFTSSATFLRQTEARGASLFDCAAFKWTFRNHLVGLTVLKSSISNCWKFSDFFFCLSDWPFTLPSVCCHLVVWHALYTIYICFMWTRSFHPPVSNTCNYRHPRGNYSNYF